MKASLQVVSILTARSLLSKLQRMGGSQWRAGGDLVPVMPYKLTIFRLHGSLRVARLTTALFDPQVVGFDSSSFCC